jgi:hypothetical protein
VNAWSNGKEVRENEGEVMTMTDETSATHQAEPQAATPRVESQAPPSPPAEPIKVQVIGNPRPWRDPGWWFTTVGPVVIAVLALVVAIVSVADQQSSVKTAEVAAARTYASEVSFTGPDGQSQFVIDNRADVPITLVLVQPAAHHALHQLAPIRGCTGITITLTSSSAPVLFFRDANGLGWELPVNGVPEPSADPSAIISLLPAAFVETAVLHPDGAPQPLQGC